MRTPLPLPSRASATGVAALLAGAILLGAGPPATWVVPAAVDLGAAADFAVLAGGGVTDTGPSVIWGDVGTHPLPAIPDLLDREATGKVDRAGARSRQAQQDLAIALAVSATLRADGTVSMAERRAVPPGVYAVADGTLGAAGLTLDGQGATSAVWIFLVPEDLATAPGSTITLVNGAQACNVFWLVGGSATLASGSAFAGSVLATTSVTAGRSVTIEGRLLARTAAVVLGGVTISVPVCAMSAATAAPKPDTGVQAVASTSRAAVAESPSALPPYLPAVTLALLVAAVVLAEPRDLRRRRPVRRRW